MHSESDSLWCWIRAVRKEWIGKRFIAFLVVLKSILRLEKGQGRGRENEVLEMSNPLFSCFCVFFILDSLLNFVFLINVTTF